MSKPLLPIDEALATVLRHVQVLPTERVPLAEAIDPELVGEVQQLTPTIEALVTPDIDESLDEESSKRRFWKGVERRSRAMPTQQQRPQLARSIQRTSSHSIAPGALTAASTAW